MGDAGQPEWRAYLSLVVGAIGRVHQCALQRALVVAAAQQLAYLLGIVLHVGRRHGRRGGRQRAQVKVGGAVGVEGIDVDGAPIDVCHGGSCSGVVCVL